MVLWLRRDSPGQSRWVLLLQLHYLHSILYTYSFVYSFSFFFPYFFFILLFFLSLSLSLYFTDYLNCNSAPVYKRERGRVPYNDRTRQISCAWKKKCHPPPRTHSFRYGWKNLNHVQEVKKSVLFINCLNFIFHLFNLFDKILNFVNLFSDGLRDMTAWQLSL